MYVCTQKGSNKATYKKLYIMKTENLKPALFIAIILVTIITIHFLTPLYYR